MTTRATISAAELAEFRNELNPDEQQTFDTMAAALKQPVKNLRWYYSFGQAVRNLRGDQPPGQRYGWMTRMAWALDCAKSLLTKTSNFARSYSGKEVETLMRAGINWGRAYPTFSLANKQEQKEWMHRAMAQD